MKSCYLVLAALPFGLISCTTTAAYRQKDGSLTVSQRGINASPATYWITGAQPGSITTADKLSIFRKFTGKTLPAIPLKCEGFIDATPANYAEIRLVEKQGGNLAQSRVNGRHKIIEVGAPRPFYHWLIP